MGIAVDRCSIVQESKALSASRGPNLKVGLPSVSCAQNMDQMELVYLHLALVKAVDSLSAARLQMRGASVQQSPLRGSCVPWGASCHPVTQSPWCLPSACADQRGLNCRSFTMPFGSPLGPMLASSRVAQAAEVGCSFRRAAAWFACEAL